MSSCAKQVTWLRRVLWEITTKHKFEIDNESWMPPTPIFSDSTSESALTKNETVAGRNKHTENKVHHLNDLWKRHIIKLLYIPSLRNVADILTKAVAFKILQKLIRLLRMKFE